MTTKYFSNFNIVSYRFGDNEKPVLFDDLTQYVDIIDGIKDNISFYNQYTIVSGDRPDTLSYKLYGTTDYYWTFYLMNDHIRESGWPVEFSELLQVTKEKYPHRTVTTNGVVAEDFPVGTVVKGNISSTIGTIVKRNLDMGQLVIDTEDDRSFHQTENIQYTSFEGAFYATQLLSESTQWNAVHHYEDENGVYQDLPIYDFGNPDASWIPISNRDRVQRRNDELKTINVLKPSVIDRVVSEFNNFHRQVS